MKAHTSWSYAPYRPPFVDCGDIYICRVAPYADRIVFDWLDNGSKEYQIYYRKREHGAFLLAGSTSELTFTIKNLEIACEYEFYVQSEEKKSRVRLARCEEPVDNIVNYLHPEDNAYAFSGRYLCSPSLVRHPEGYLLASMDLFAGGYPQNLTLIYRSDDEGKNWKYVSELFPCFWGKMFIYQNELYMLACSTEYGDLLIGKSMDGGKNFTPPTVLLRGGGGKNGEAGVHKNPQPVVEYNGRIWNTLEWGSWGRGYHAGMVMSAPIGSDLLNPESFSFSEPVQYDPNWPGLPQGTTPGNLEGCLIEQEGKLYSIMRYQMQNMKPNFGKALVYEVNTENPEAPLNFCRCMDFPANHSKFVIKYHEKTGNYYSLGCRILNEQCAGARNLLSLLVSKDLKKWEVDRDVIDMRERDPGKYGFQYVDFEIEGDEILYLSRTAMNQAHNFHDSNYSTFGKINIC